MPLEPKTGAIASSTDATAYMEAAAITPHDTNPNPFRSIWVGGTGNVTLRALGSSADVVITAVPAGVLLPIATSFIRATGTTATLMVGLN